jgi:hypothetical protein
MTLFIERNGAHASHPSTLDVERRSASSLRAMRSAPTSEMAIATLSAA